MYFAAYSSILFICKSELKKILQIILLDRTNKNQQQYRNLNCTLVCLTDNQQEFPLTFSFSDELEALITQTSTLRYRNAFSVLDFEKIIKYAKKKGKME